jgi:diguanylate cyclase
MKPASSSSQAGLALEYLTKERVRFDEQRRVVYIVVGCLGILLLLYDLVGQISNTPLERTVYILNDSVFALCCAIYIWLAYTRRVSLNVLERSFFAVLALESFIFNSLAPYWFSYSLQEVFTETIADDVWLLVLVGAFALHLFAGWRGVLVAAGIYLASFAAIGLYVFLYTTNSGSSVASLVIENYVAAGMVLCFLSVLAKYRDNAQRISVQYEMLEKIAFLDALTSLPNRRRMYDVIQEQLELAHRYQTPFCIALLDIDHFKRINDTLGHIKGDEVLVQVAHLLRAEVRVTDQLGRWGGEEFLLVLSHISLAEALAALGRSRQVVETQIKLEDEDRAVTVSCGVTAYLPGDSATSLLQRADDALYEAKERGRNRVCSSEDNENSRLSRERLFS